MSEMDDSENKFYKSDVLNLSTNSQKFFPLKNNHKIKIFLEKSCTSNGKMENNRVGGLGKTRFRKGNNKTFNAK